MLPVFRSLNLEADNRQKEKAGESAGTAAAGRRDGARTHTIIGGMQTLDSTQAILLPIGASVSLLVMFFFFDSLQTVFALCTAVIATIAFAFLLLPMCQYLIRPCSDGHK
jgi:signal peptide peptidase-like protein 3